MELIILCLPALFRLISLLLSFFFMPVILSQYSFKTFYSYKFPFWNNLLRELPHFNGIFYSE
ncbi:hypothetical protein VCRA2120E57_1020004 [Vibrio crassostreae]|nr:hypothetical protein VCRA2120E57_1020004 [Vibrio crassostreae]